jgi:uncharacterized protein HemY
MESLGALATLALQQKNPAKALQSINQQIALNPSQAKLYEMQGQIYANQKDYAKAEQAFRKALSIDNKNLNAYNLLSQLFISQNAGDKAIKVFMISKETVPRRFKAIARL